jgi:O-antigen ligase
LALLLSPPVLRDKAVDLLDPNSPGNLDRVEVWRNGVELFLQHPWTGWGLGDLSDEYARVKSPGEPPEGHMRSVPIHVAASMGLPGLLAFGWLVVSLFRVLARARRETFGFLRRTVDAAEAGLVAFLAAGLVEWNLGDSEILALLGFLIGVAIASGRLAPLADRAHGGIGLPREDGA